MTPEPNACQHCDAPQRMHFSRYVDGVGWHQWTAPTDQQRLSRMLARRAERGAAAYLAALKAAAENEPIDWLGGTIKNPTPSPPQSAAYGLFQFLPPANYSASTTEREL